MKTISKVAMTIALVAISLFALGVPAMASTGLSGPTPPKVGDPVSKQSEIQVVSLPTGTIGGTWTITVDRSSAGLPAPATCTSAAIQWNASASNVASALTGSSACGSGTFVVLGNSGTPEDDAGPFQLIFSGAFSGLNFALATANFSALSPAGGASVALTGVQDGVDYGTTRVDPHGSYSSATDYCLQCHSIHNAPGGGAGGYALLAEGSVVDVCATCHKLFGNNATGPNIPDGSPNGFPGIEATASLRTAYDVTASPLGYHQLGSTNPPAPDNNIGITQLGWGYGGFNPVSWSAATVPAAAGTYTFSQGGLYCGSCHTTHGEFGQVVNATVYRTEITDAAFNANEVQRVSLTGFAGGNTWTLTFFDFDGNALTTGTLTHPATAGDVQTALTGLTGLGGVTVAGAAGGPYTVTFPNMNVNPLRGNVTSGTGTISTTSAPYVGAATAPIANGEGFDGTIEQVHVWADGKPFYSGRNIAYMHLDTDPAQWETCTARGPFTAVPAAVDTVVGGTCSAMTTTDSEGQAVSLYGYKLLSAYPNHQWLSPESWNVDISGHDASRWCGACHPSKVSSDFGTAFTMHNHPTSCTACHGNPNDFTSYDFPHTSTFDAFLKAYPDALCINCHVAGSLP